MDMKVSTLQLILDRTVYPLGVPLCNVHKYASCTCECPKNWFLVEHPNLMYWKAIEKSKVVWWT